MSGKKSDKNNGAFIGRSDSRKFKAGDKAIESFEASMTNEERG